MKEKISFGPTTMSLGVNPLKNPPIPSFLINFASMDSPDSGELNGLFWILVYQNDVDCTMDGS